MRTNIPIFALFISLIALSNSYAQIPEGFTEIFDGESLEGWHISRTTHQGTTPNFYVEDGILKVEQHPFGQGGVLLTDKKYKNFELFIEVKTDTLINSGIFLRSTESGVAYQIEICENCGNTGDLIGERVSVSRGAQTSGREDIWNAEGWNSFRIRMVGDNPHLTLWINGVEMWDVTQPQNDLILNATEGMIGLQSHWTALYSPSAGVWNGFSSWVPGSNLHFRNIAIKELPESLQD